MAEEKSLTLPVLDLAGKEVNKVELSGYVFATEVNNQVMFDAVQVYQANLRQATAKTKKRSEVSGGGIKPWRQKGTGRARAGSSRSPLWRHGGIVFGPTGNQNFKLSQNKRAHDLALRSALTVKFNEGQVKVVDKMELESNKTKGMLEVIKNLSLPAKTLFVAADYDYKTFMAARNIQDVILTTYDNFSVYNLLNANCVVFTYEALKILGAIEGEEE